MTAQQEPAATMARVTDHLTSTARSRVRRLADRGRTDRSIVDEVLDEAYVAHVGFVVDGQPRVLPMTYGRDGDVLYLHGAVGNAMLRASTDAEVCVTVTLLDGLVLARSAFHHSMNYRSVVLLGTATKVEDVAEKARAFDVIVDHVVPGRSQVARPSNDSELRQTLVLRLPIVEGAAKVRSGDAIDDEADLTADIWAGVVPLRQVAGDPVANADLGRPVPAPDPSLFVRRAGGDLATWVPPPPPG
jgi:nitroimidazol reductase NimA-like FMN-containing flavoprotein (pyridoxamine 5'-phosphate oxidase superfamily)